MIELRRLAVTLVTLLVALGFIVGSPVQDSSASGTATVTAPPQPTFALSTTGQDPGDFVISGFGGSDTLLVSIGFVNPPASVSFALPTTSGLSASFGYNFTGGKTQISFTGTMANANAALAAMTVDTGASSGDITIRVTASVNKANVYYNPINGHFYEYVARSNTMAYAPGNTANSAVHLAEARTLFGVRGYLATITSAQEQAFVFANVNATNIWLGGSDGVEPLNERVGSFANQSAAEGKWYWIAGPDAGTQFWSGTTNGTWVGSDGNTLAVTAGNAGSARYENWCDGNAGSSPDASIVNSNFGLKARGSSPRSSLSEPNGVATLSTNGEQYLLEKWSGSPCWNDWGRTADGVQGGFLVEYSESWGTGTSGTWNAPRGSFATSGSDVIASSSVTALVDNAPRNAAASGPSSSAMTVSWLAPLTGSVTGYTVTSTPGGLSCSTSGTSCTVSGLSPLTSYTFVVRATFDDMTTKDSLATVAVSTVATGSGGGTGGSGGSGGGSPSTPSLATPNTPGPNRQPTPLSPGLQSGPVLRNNQPSAIPSAPTAVVNGVPTRVQTLVTDPNNLNIRAGVLNIGINVQQNEGLVRQGTNGETEVQVRHGGATGFQGSGLAPRSFVQVFMPLQGANARELARIPVDETGSFSGEAVFRTSLQDSPLPIGRQTLQMVTLDEQGRQNVVEIAVNIVQPAPAPEINRENGQTPRMLPGQSLATNAGVPEVVNVTVIPNEKQTIIEGDGWTMGIAPDSDGSNVVETDDGNVLLELVRDETATVSGSGFMPGTRADVWLFSDPTLLGTVEIDENGAFNGTVSIDGQVIAVGEHTLQLQGVGEDGYVRAANLGVVVNDAEAPASTEEAAGGLLWWLLVLLALLAVLILLYARSRRRA